MEQIVPSRKFFTFFYATMGIIEAVLVTEFVFTLSADIFSSNMPFVVSNAFGDVLKVEIVGIILTAVIIFAVEWVRRAMGSGSMGRASSKLDGPPPPSS